MQDEFNIRTGENLWADVGHEEDSLPLLEFALSELWQPPQQRTLAHRAYVEIGRLEGALSRHADPAYAELLEAEKEPARRVFVPLVAFRPVFSGILLSSLLDGTMRPS